LLTLRRVSWPLQWYHPHMAIRWVSTPESIKANQPSVLAIVETLAAMGIAVWIAVRWETYVHIAIGASIAPLLLMRTDQSCIRTLKYFHWVGRSLPYLKSEQSLNWMGFVHLFVWINCVAIPVWVITALASEIRSTLFLVITWIFITLALPLIQFAAWLVTLVRSPVASIAAIPNNWRQLTIALDSRQWPHVFHPPDTIPEDSTASDFLTVQDAFLVSLKQSSRTLKIIFFVLLPLVCIPAFAYRWSIKSTALIWFPLLWAMRSTKEVDGPLQSSLAVYRRDPVTKIVVGVSIAAIVGFIVKIILHYEWAGFAAWWNEGPLRQFFALYVSPLEIQKWQIAMAINSAIAIVMYILAGSWLVRLEHERMTEETWPRRVFKTGLFIRPILSCYTIACMIYITIIAAWELEWPLLGEKWFPWQ